jgi:hypothetical protein
MRKSHVIVCALTLLLCAHASASPVTYTVISTASGSLGGTPFTDQQVTFTTTADTANVIAPPGFPALVLGTPPAIQVTGFAPTTATDQFWVFCNQSDPRAGLYSSTNGAFIIYNDSAAFAGYDLTTSIGPVSGVPTINNGVTAPTAAGLFTFTSMSAVSFQAVVVPEPATLTLLAFSLIPCTARARSDDRPSSETRT